MFGDHGLCGLLEEGAHGKSPKCLGGNLGDFGEFCKGLLMLFNFASCFTNLAHSENIYPPEYYITSLTYMDLPQNCLFILYPC